MDESQILTSDRLIWRLPGFLCWAALTFVLGIAGGVGATVLAHSGPAIEGRLNGFAGAKASHIASVVEGDWFADTGKAVTSFGTVYNAYSPVADVFTVRVEGYRVRLKELALVCPGPAIIEFFPSDESIAYLRGSPWPCETLIVALTRTDTEVTIVVTISLDGHPLRDDKVLGELV